MGSYDGVSDEELIRRYRAGESGISDYLIEKYKGMIRTRARAMYLIGGDTDDLIQEGMIGMFKAIRDYQPDREASFFTFATMCVERQLISAIKNYNRQKNMVLNQAVPLEPIEVAEGFFRHFEEENPENIVIAQESRIALEELIREHLSPLEMDVLRYYLAGESYTRIGERLGKPPKAIDNALQRIRKKISLARQ